MNDRPSPPASTQLELNFSAEPKRPPLRLVQGEGKRVQEPLASRDAVIRVLVEAGADVLLRRISSERAEEIQDHVDKVLDLFDRVDRTPALMPVLQRELEHLESLMTQTRAVRAARRP